MPSKETKICVVGLGYVGLPLACALSKHFSVSGFDKSKQRIAELQQGTDRTNEVENLGSFAVTYSSEPSILEQANFIIVAVPTPVMKDHRPDLRFIEKACLTVAEHLRPGAVVVFESTVYPGCTEEVCVPLLEQQSGLKCGVDFKVGYSPERANPGDKTHTVGTIVKVVSGMDAESLETISKVYGSITTVFAAASIKVAEAAKVIENVQRDLNIALMNELALIFDKLGINTREVIAAAATKWNFNVYYPGLVGGHCIGVDPYYLTYKAKQVGHHPQVILAGRRTNESMAGFVASKLAGAKRVLVMGVTFKENVPDIRNSKAEDLVQALKQQGATVVYYDPLVDRSDAFGEKIENWPPLEPVDAIVVCSPHEAFRGISLADLRSIAAGNQPLLFDVKAFYPSEEAEARGFKYFTL